MSLETDTVVVSVKEEPPSCDEERVTQEEVDMCVVVKIEREYGDEEMRESRNEEAEEVTSFSGEQETGVNELNPLQGTYEVPVEWSSEPVVPPASEPQDTKEKLAPRPGTGMECHNCGRQFTMKQNYRSHIENMTCVRNQCPVCRRLFTNKYFQKHLATHSEQRLYSCTVCDKSFKDSCGLNAHTKIHTGVRPFVCKAPGCTATFIHSNALRKHTIVHQLDHPYACDYCGKRFKRSRYLLNHLQLHAETKQYTCDVCKKQFATKGYLIHHLRTHSDVRSYKCDECGNRFRSKTHLNRHLRSHAGLRPFVCGTCDATFTTGSWLRAHERLHTGEKPYICSDCGQSFAQRAPLNEHRRIHTREPLRCRTCGGLFETRGKLRVHRKTHKVKKEKTGPKKTRKLKKEKTESVKVHQVKLENTESE